ncbi:hypothetical protein V5O48_019413, partial [Marasmius crinis-equi]
MNHDNFGFETDPILPRAFGDPVATRAELILATGGPYMPGEEYQDDWLSRFLVYRVSKEKYVLVDHLYDSMYPGDETAGQWLIPVEWLENPCFNLAGWYAEARTRYHGMDPARVINSWDESELMGDAYKQAIEFILNHAQTYPGDDLPHRNIHCECKGRFLAFREKRYEWEYTIWDTHRDLKFKLPRRLIARQYFDLY